jgi:hypothetical protein
MVALPETTAPPKGLANAVTWVRGGIIANIRNRQKNVALIVIYFFLFNGPLIREQLTGRAPLRKPSFSCHMPCFCRYAKTSQPKIKEKIKQKSV